MFEKVHMIWDLYDGPRTGIADFNGTPHYFNCALLKEGGYSEEFELFPIDSDLLHLAEEYWSIYREWEMKFRTGHVTGNTHPGHRGQNFRYDELQDKIQKELRSLHKIDCQFAACFQALPGQSDLPAGVLRNLEVKWSNAT